MEKEIMEAAREIVRKMNIMRNVPYSYQGQNYLSAELVVAMIIRDKLKIGNKTAV
jgi:hypothetical protein